MTIKDVDHFPLVPSATPLCRPDDAIDLLSRLDVAALAFERVLAEVSELALTAVPATGCALTYAVAPRYPSAEGAQVGTTSPRVESLVRAELDLGRGPASDAWATGRGTRSGDLAHDLRWPGWSRRATSSGMRSALATVLPGPGSGPVTLLWLDETADRFGVVDEDAAHRFAAVAGPAVRSASLATELRSVRANLDLALRSRASIDQAIGILVARGGGTPEDALQRLRARSQREHVKVSELARRTVEEAVRRGRPASGAGLERGTT
ncbi:ANTAR domain-containing protein [Jatrophihabitans sp. YIM 134969]